MKRMPVLLCVSVTFILSTTIMAGTLDEFEKNTSKKKAKKASSTSSSKTTSSSGDKHRHHHHDDSPSLYQDYAGSAITSFMYHSFFIGGLTSHHRLSGEEDREFGLMPREGGDIAIPFARVDVAFREVSSEIDSMDYRLELGYGAFAFRYEQSRYEEEPDDELDLIRWQGVYRMSFSEKVELDVGLGQLTIDGNNSDSRFAFSLPLMLRPTELLGIEIRPSWSEDVTDYDVGILLSRHYVSLKAGYRWVTSRDVSLDGPYAGIAIHF